ncbi:MAG: ACT domain-containing protein [Candidatus Diapherotrites archaeon]
MPGTKNLGELLRSMKPEPVKGEYVFCTVPESRFGELKIPAVMAFREKEGVTVIIEKEAADIAGLPYCGAWAMITLTVHSDLAAVGFLAAITKKLAKNGISVNAVSAYYHDHLFVPAGKAKKAMKLLGELPE